MGLITSTISRFKDECDRLYVLGHGFGRGMKNYEKYYACKIKAFTNGIKVAEDFKRKCTHASNPEKCVVKATKIIMKLKNRVSKLEAKLVEYKGR